MYLFVLSVHLVLCLILVLVILMQPGKGADISSAFGGGASSQLFGASGPGNFLTRGTGLAAAMFFVTSVVLTFLSEDAAGIGGDAADSVEDVLQDGEEGAGFGSAPTSTPTPPPEAPAPGTPPSTPAPTAPPVTPAPQ